MYKDNIPHSAVICHPFEQELLIAEKGSGAYLFALDGGLNIISSGKKITASTNEKLEGEIVYLDAFFTNRNTIPKTQLIQKLDQLANGNLGIRLS